MRQIYSFVLVSSLVAGICSAAVHHTTRMPGLETGNIHFIYDPQSNNLVAQTTSQCFFVTLTRDEKDHVHTNYGMEDLQLKMLREMLGTYEETRTYHNDANLPINIKHWCHNQDIYQLKRSLDELGSSTVPNIIG